MAVEGWINRRSRVGVRRGQPSRVISLQGSESSLSGQLSKVEVLSISSSGMLLGTSAPLSLRESILILFPECGSRPAEVVWAGDNLFACQFDKMLTPKMITEVCFQDLEFETQERPRRADTPPQPAGDQLESMGQRIRRIRLSRGMSQMVLANRVGVSRPTLLKWEKDKSLPRQEMVSELSIALDVPEIELLYGQLRDKSAWSDDQLFKKAQNG